MGLSRKAGKKMRPCCRGWWDKTSSRCGSPGGDEEDGLEVVLFGIEMIEKFAAGLVGLLPVRSQHWKARGVGKREGTAHHAMSCQVMSVRDTCLAVSCLGRKRKE
jgi:hypothetical protein